MLDLFTVMPRQQRLQQVIIHVARDGITVILEGRCGWTAPGFFSRDRDAFPGKNCIFATEIVGREEGGGGGAGTLCVLQLDASKFYV